MADDTIARVVALPGKPEFMTLDGHGQVFVNIADHPAIAKVDISRR